MKVQSNCQGKKVGNWSNHSLYRIPVLFPIKDMEIIYTKQRKSKKLEKKVSWNLFLQLLMEMAL